MVLLDGIFCCGNGGFDWKKKRENKSAWRIFSLKELHAATNNFNYDNKLGEGGIGSIYWGQLWDGSQIAVKRLKVWNDKAETEFAVEVEILARVRHKNLLSLRGYCCEGQERVIVYDYMPNLSLLSHLFGQHSSECLLDWKRRMDIAIGCSEGILYLHHHATPHMIHGGIKSSNILLDSNFQPKVADFGFTKLIPNEATTAIKKTLGYLAPEQATLGNPSESSDVYSFGILLLEIVTGGKSLQSITEWVVPLVRQGKFRELSDPKLNGNIVEEQLRRVTLIALGCAQKQPEKRLTMLDVVELLKGETKDKLVDLENALFRSWQIGDDEKCDISEDNPASTSENALGH